MRNPETAVRRSVIAKLSESPSDTEAVAAAMAPVLSAGDVLLLTGDLGAGKTTFVRGLARGLGARGVRSPSFAIHLRYPGRLPLHHFDLYRLTSPRDLDELGLEDVLERDGIVVVEWGERLGEWAPERAVRLRFEDLGGSRRRLLVEGPVAVIHRIQASGEWESVPA